MMTTTDPAEGAGFTADIPDDVRRRIETAGEMQRTLDALGVGRQILLPKPNPKLTYAEPQNCSLHFLSPNHEVVPSFTTLVGLSLCPPCALRAGELVVNERLSTAEMIEHALIGTWLDEDVDGRTEAA
ncbi:hypothetical protein PBI_DEWDROP_88 [Microbacterium phage Dewdrop]|nr:hypothetical protein PBI_LEAF_88 [Microbacterium phage Leaf]QGZ17456.1 hypothetical protein PBI_DEWDROP_88 [Microbacterium phage Dewdrop]